MPTFIERTIIGASTLTRHEPTETTRPPETARPGDELDMLTPRSRRFVAAAAGLVLAAALATGCGSASSEPRVAAVAKAADAVHVRAQDHLAMDRALAQRLTRQHQERLREIRVHDHLAMDRALAQRPIREHRDRPGS